MFGRLVGAPAHGAARVLEPKARTLQKSLRFTVAAELVREGQRQRVAVIGRGMAALLHVRLALQHQQVAPIDVIFRSRQVGPSLSSSWIQPFSGRLRVRTDQWLYGISHQLFEQRRAVLPFPQPRARQLPDWTIHSGSSENPSARRRVTRQLDAEQPKFRGRRPVRGQTRNAASSACEAYSCREELDPLNWNLTMNARKCVWAASLFQEALDAFTHSRVHGRHWPRVDSHKRVRHNHRFSRWGSGPGLHVLA
jgi:hypothetical protein